jgi:PAS domain S-box-containing protein
LDVQQSFEPKQLAEHRCIFAAVVAGSQDFIGISSPEGIPVYVNPAGLAMVGLDSLADAQRHHVLDFFMPEDRSRIESEAIQALCKEGRWRGECRFRHFKTGAPIPTLWNVVTLRGENTRPIAWATISPNLITQVRARESLLRADRRKDAFLTTLCHELRTPLASIKNAARMLDSPQLELSQRAQAQSIIQRQVAHMSGLLDDLLDVARIARGKLKIKQELIDLASLVETAVDDVRPLLDRKGHRLKMTLPATSIRLMADPLRLSQVLSNLLTNAVKYTDTGGQIELSAGVAGTLLTLAVSDTGIGIPHNSLAEIFEMFTQVDGGNERAEGGLGVGLALVKGIVECHGGSVVAASDGPGRGSTFTLRLPVVADDVVPPDN